MPKIYLKDTLDMPDKYLRYAWKMFEIFLRHALYAPHIGWHKAEKLLMYSWDMPKISVRNAQNNP